MTGADVTRIRRWLGLTRAQFADVLCVHLGSVYRWEAAKAVRVDPLLHAILSRMQKWPKWQAQQEGARLVVLLNERRDRLAPLARILGVLTWSA